MYLKSLELQGFKSFPDKTRLDFNKGISAVVGPNGSGKSNIGDAMRWVMGEQSSKTLRGGKMEDIIFSGTKSRPRASFAQVTVTIDNADRALPEDADLVMVSRKLYRNGDSEYIINGKNVRLKDVVELFMDTGLGKDGYSIIGQGKIADIISSKSSDRREIFDEAAGISKFRYKKEEAERKLAAAEDNISRLNDIISELEGRVGPLKKQAEKAKMFRELDSRKSELEISVWAYRLDKYIDELKGYEEKLSALSQQYTDISEELEQLDEEMEESFAKSAEESEKSDSLKQEIHEIELRKTRSSADCAVLENDIKHLEDTIAQIRDEIEKSNSSKYFLESELEKRIDEGKEIDKRMENLDEDTDEKEKELSELRAVSDDFSETMGRESDELNKLYLKKSELSFNVELAKNTISETEEQIKNDVDTQKELEEKESFVSSQLKKQRKSKAEFEDKLEENKNKLSGYEKLFASKSQKLDDVNNQFRENDIKLRETIQKLNLLNDLENSMEGFAYSVKQIINASKQGRLSGICGSVAQLISVPKEYSVAIETALGGAMQNVVVENEDCAKRGIRLLKESKAGRATFLPITSVRGKKSDYNLKDEEGFVAIACDLVNADKKYSGIILSLLGRICIAENIDLGAVIAKKYGYKFKIVTLDGQVINAGGSFTGGSVSKTTGILTRKNEMQTLAEKRVKLDEQKSVLSEKQELLKNETAKLKAESEGIKEKLAQLNQQVLKLDMEIQRACEIRRQYESELDNIDLTLANREQKLKQTNEELEKAVHLLSDIQNDISQKEQKLEASQNKRDELISRREKLTEELSELKLKAVELSKDKEACRLSVEQIQSSISNSSDDCGRLEEKILEHKNTISEKQRVIESIKQRADNSDEEIEKINKMIAASQARHIEYDNQANALRARQKIKTDEKEKLSGEINRLSERKNSVGNDFEKLTGQLWDEYQLTRSDVENRGAELENIGEANRQLAELRSQIKALGNVNLGAIEEYAEVSERYEFMTSQLGDVQKSRMELTDLINDLTENMKAVFTDSFYKINRNFQQIFKELFGGGQGELILTDPENVLESGIDIKVEPPGKVIKNLSLLSGGEQSFIAVVIYFAILKVRPSPFCILDEIEAALDDVNVTKFARYLHKFTDTTQFITITHRRGTMEEADILYGVTMQEDGISKLLKMNMSEKDQVKL